MILISNYDFEICGGVIIKGLNYKDVEKKKRNLLVIEPHSDDSCFGAGAYLDFMKSKYDLYFQLVTASSLKLHHKYVSREERIYEYSQYVKSFEGKLVNSKSRNNEFILPIDKESRLDTISQGDLVSAIENAIYEIRPDQLLIMGPSFHHDHTIVYEAVKAATRPTFKFTVKKILLMESPTYIHTWNEEMKPNFFFTFGQKELERKIERFENCFPSQIREAPNYYSREGIKKWSSYRGFEARSEYAEAFKLIFEQTS